MFTIKVEAVGFGLGFNRYHRVFEFTMNGTPDSWDRDEIVSRIKRQAQEKTACKDVNIIDYKFCDIYE